MKMQLKSGFTIIEVMLFLAITGLLIAGILGGTNQALNNQRYRAGVELIRDTIRAQYANSLSLNNLMTSGDGGDENAVDPCSVIESPGAIEEYGRRGASDCLYVGKLILLEATEAEKITHLKIYPVVAKVLSSGVSGVFDDLSEAPGPVTDQNSLHVAAFTENSNLIVDKPVDWGLVAVTPKPDESIMNVGILVFRSPISGTLTTYIIEDTNTLGSNYLNELHDYMDPDNNIKDLKLCMADMTGPLDQANRRAIIVNAGATGPGDVETLGEAAKC